MAYFFPSFEQTNMRVGAQHILLPCFANISFDLGVAVSCEAAVTVQWHWWMP
jgi:hypothetical protein